MDFCRNITVSGGLPSKYQPEQLLSSPSSKLGSLDDLFSSHNTEGDVSLEWLSIFVEDCFSSSGNYCLPPAVAPTDELQKTIASITTASSKPLQSEKEQQPHQNPTASSLHKFVIPPGKARSKRRRRSCLVSTESKTPRVTSWWSHQYRYHPLDRRNLQMTMTSSSSDPPLLQQAYWLADSELILPPQNKGTTTSNSNSNSDSREGDRGGDEQEEGPKDELEVVGKEEEVMVVMGKENRGGSSLEGLGQGQGQQPRRCSHCLVQRTPQWRAGPLGPKTLCNACGVRYKSGRLLPEYRPAKSPTFVSYKHSNSHKKVMEMRMSLLSSIPPSSSSSS